METLTSAVNTVSSTVANTLWGPPGQEKDDKDLAQQEERKEAPEHSNHPQPTKDEPASLDRYPSVMGTVTPPSDDFYEKRDATVSDLASLSLNPGCNDSKLEMSHDRTGYPFADTSKKEEAITGSSTGNTATLFTLIDAGGGTDRDLEGADPREGKQAEKGHSRHDSGFHGLGHQDHMHREGQTPRAEDGKDSGKAAKPSRATPATQKEPTREFDHKIASKPNIEPSVGASPPSGAQPTQKHQGADRPKEIPEGNSEKSESQGTGEKYVTSTGTAVSGGDFDARKPGAGREADRLLEQAGVHREVPRGSAHTQPHEGHKAGDISKQHSSDSGCHASEHQAVHAAEGEHGKKSLGDKIKEKLHIKKDHH